MIDSKRQHENAMIASVVAGDASAWDWLHNRYKALVWKFARRYKMPDQEVEDAAQIGFLALYEAAKRYNPANEFGASFMTFAHRWVSGRMLSEQRRGHLVRLPTRNEAGVRANHYLAVESIDESLGDDNRTVQSLLADPRSVDAGDDAAREEQVAHLRRCLSLMSPRERDVLLMRIDGHALHAIGDEYGVSKERIRQIEMAAMKRLKGIMERTPVGSPKLEVKTVEVNGTMDLVAALQQATDADIRKVDSEIATLKGKIGKLVSMRRVLVSLVHGKQKRAARVSDGQPHIGVHSPEKKAEMLARRTKIAAVILKNGGPMREGAISDAAGIEKGKLTCIYNHPWFKHVADGWTVTTQGKSESAKVAAA